MNSFHEISHLKHISILFSNLFEYYIYCRASKSIPNISFNETADKPSDTTGNKKDLN